MSATSTLATKTSISSDYQVTNTEGTDLDRMYCLSNQILLTGYDIDRDSQQFLNENQDVALVVPQISTLVNKALNLELTPLLEIVKDEESLDVRRLSLIFKIQNRSYDEILRIWDSLSKPVYQNLDTVIAKKIAIVLDGD